MNIMIVDDNPRMRRMIRAMVSSEAEDIVEFDDAARAVEEFPRSMPDLILMDIVMKEMDGIEATRALTKRYPSTRVIIVSQYGDEDLRKAAFEAGAVAYVSKEKLTTLGDVVRSLKYKPPPGR